MPTQGPFQGIPFIKGIPHKCTSRHSPPMAVLLFKERASPSSTHSACRARALLDGGSATATMLGHCARASAHSFQLTQYLPGDFH